MQTVFCTVMHKKVYKITVFCTVMLFLMFSRRDRLNQFQYLAFCKYYELMIAEVYIQISLIPDEYYEYAI